MATPVCHPWLFPIGVHSRAGLGSCLDQTQLTEALANFTPIELGLSPDGRHGGYFPYRRRPASTAHVFRISDTAGQCIPLTEEGIRPALYFGAMAGRLARRVLDGTMRETDALRAYRKFVEHHVEAYRYFLVAGEPGGSLALQGNIRRHFGWEVTAPKIGEVHEIV